MKKQHVLYVVILFAIALARVYQLPNGNDLVIKWLPAANYTHQESWYFLWSRVLEFAFALFLYLESKNLGIFFISVLAFFKIIDEQSVPFAFFSYPEFMAWIIATLVTYYQWTKTKKRRLQPK